MTTAPHPPHGERELLKIVILGHVDHGKSTLVGRLFHDTGSLPDGKVEAIRAMCERRGMPFEWAFLMDAMQAERDQGVTIDTAQIWFKTAKRDYVLIDAPGHVEFLKNMVTGASQADAGVLVVDAAEGVQEQSRRHGYLLHLLGVRQVTVVVNKMDLVGYEQARFDEVRRGFDDYLRSIGVTATYFVPASAREGDNVVGRSDGAGADNMTWHDGPTLVDALDAFSPSSAAKHLPLRMPVQDVYKFDERRIIAGRIESGAIEVGDRLVFMPSGRTGRVKTIEDWAFGERVTRAHAEAGASVGFTLESQIFVERGEIAAFEAQPPVVADTFRARVFWLGREPFVLGKRYKLKLGSAEAPVQAEAVHAVIDTSALERLEGDRIERNQAGEITLKTMRPIALDDFESNARTGRFVLVDDYDIAGGGVISDHGLEDARRQASDSALHLSPVDLTVEKTDRTRRNGHAGGVMWFTGLSGAGKSTLATALEKRLFDRGYVTYVLDGDNVRRGLNRDLGFSETDRAENIRRVGEVAALFADAGVLVLTAFISPYRADRDQARAAAGDAFHEVYVAANLETCERRDPKGLYRKAREGVISEFTGISAPYEEPRAAELVVQTDRSSVEECVEELVAYVDRRFRR